MYEDYTSPVDVEPCAFESDSFDDSDLPVAPESWKIEDFEDILSAVNR